MVSQTNYRIFWNLSCTGLLVALSKNSVVEQKKKHIYVALVYKSLFFYFWYLFHKNLRDQSFFKIEITLCRTQARHNSKQWRIKKTSSLLRCNTAFVEFLCVSVKQLCQLWRKMQRLVLLCWVVIRLSPSTLVPIRPDLQNPDRMGSVVSEIHALLIHSAIS